MIRALSITLAALSTAGCSWLPGLDFPELTVKPQYYLLEVDGNTNMQSAPSGPPPQDNPSIDLQNFGLTKRDDDYGGTLAYGDGFSGLEFGYLNVDIDTTDRGELTAPWGALPTGTTVTSNFAMDEYKLRYIGQLLDYETDEALRIRFGIGAAVTHRDGQISVLADGAMNSQIAEFSDDGVPYAAARARADYRGFSVTGDYAYTATTFGGDFDGTMQDFAIDVAYTLEDQDITIFGGFRWIELPISGVQPPFDFDADLTLEGFVLGAELSF